MQLNINHQTITKKIKIKIKFVVKLKKFQL